MEERMQNLNSAWPHWKFSMAKLEGLLEGLREAITRPHAA